MKKLGLAICGLACSGLMGAAAPAGTAITVSYECERGAQINATYLSVTEGAYVVIMAEGRQVALKAESNNGRYVSVEKDVPYVWWIRNADAELLVTMGGSDIPVLSECKES